MPRLPPVTSDQVPPELRFHYEDGELPQGLAGVMATNPWVLAAFESVLGTLHEECGLSRYQQELLIASVIAELEASYLWHHRVSIAEGAGVDRQVLTAIAAEEVGGFSPVEQALIAYARAVVSGTVDDGLHERVETHFYEEEIVGIAGLATMYCAVTRCIEAFDVTVDADEDFIGWDPS